MIKLLKNLNSLKAIEKKRDKISDYLLSNPFKSFLIAFYPR